jgi:hypothetical protein
MRITYRIVRILFQSSCLFFLKCENVEAKRRQNIEDNRRFLAALKINDVSYHIQKKANSLPSCYK